LGEVLLLNKASNTKRRQLVVGNWKMNGNQQSIADLLSRILQGWNGEHAAEVVVCPPYPYLQHALELLEGSSIVLGAQSVNEHEGGAFTGEISAGMLVDWQCKYVIVGHNERRRMQHENDAQVAQKFFAAQNAGLIPIFCIGESLSERDKGQTLDVIERQLRAVLDETDIGVFAKAVIAYEPIWAVGTGITAEPEQAQEVHRFIRSLLGDVGEQTRILYGGSVKGYNAEQLFAMPDIDGALLGGASLDADEFLTICTAADR
jgi:triosephosphate isomerase